MTLACRIHGARDLRLEPDETAPLAPHEVELRLGAAGICGSDLHYFQHGRVGAFVIREPLIPGHEASGVVLRTGVAVASVAPGMKVAINPSHPCGRCDYCRAGRANLCRNMRFLGSASVYPHVQGMFRERFVMAERQLLQSMLQHPSLFTPADLDAVEPDLVISGQRFTQHEDKLFQM